MPLSQHIVIAEDHGAVRSMLLDLIRRYYPSARVSAVADGAAALALCTADEADLLLTTERLPDLAGLELIRLLRALQVHFPILMFSADDSLAAPALAAGATSFLAKPSGIHELLEVLTQLLPA